MPLRFPSVSRSQFTWYMGGAAGIIRPQSQAISHAFSGNSYLRLQSLGQRYSLSTTTYCQSQSQGIQAGLDDISAIRTFGKMNAAPTLSNSSNNNGHVEGQTLTMHTSSSTTQQQSPPYKNLETVALVVEKPKEPFKLEPIILDEVRDNELLIEMKYSGICHTDLVMQQGLLPMVEYPAIFGHEGAGTILEIGSAVKDTSLSIGDSVLLSFNTCGSCPACISSHPAYCHLHPQVNHNAVRLSDRSTPATLKASGRPVRSQYFGQSSFAKRSVVNEKCVVKCPFPELMEIYAPIGCGFQTGAGTVLNVLKPGKEDSLVIFGMGSVGIAALMAAVYAGCGRVVAVDIVEEKLGFARELGATETINSKVLMQGGGKVVDEIRKLTGGRGASMAVDCTGVIPVIEEMVDCIGPQGTAVIVGVPPPGKKITVDPLAMFLDNKKLIGLVEGDSNPQVFIPQLIEMHQKGHFPIEKLCRTYPVEKLEEAIHDMHTGKVVKPVISWG